MSNGIISDGFEDLGVLFDDSIPSSLSDALQSSLFIVRDHSRRRHRDGPIVTKENIILEFYSDRMSSARRRTSLRFNEHSMTETVTIVAKQLAQHPLF